MDSVIGSIVAAPPPAGYHASFVRLGATESYDLRELYELAGRLALRLLDLGVRPGERIGILAANSLEWVLLDIAALRLKVVTAGFEPGKFEPGPELLERYGLKLLFTDRPSDGTAIVPTHEVRRLAGLPPPAGPLAKPGPLPPADRLSPPDPLSQADPLPQVEYAPDEATTLKFTSGSTGRAKGLAATVGSIDSSLHAVQEMFAHGDGDNLFVFLPLSLLQQRYWIYSALRFGHDVTISTYEAAFATMRSARPTVVMGVPGFYETAMRHIKTRAGDVSTASGSRPDRVDGEAMRAAAVELFGDRIRYLWTGSAPAREQMLRFFNGVGLPIFEGYGLNETCIVTKNHPGANRPGSVGRVVPGKQVLFDESGVIIVRSDHPVAWRYEYSGPGESESIFQADGTVRTGDVGYMDEDGYLFVQGRADDTIVLENGKNVIVRPIEERLKASQAIAECVLFCPDQTHLIVIISPSAEPADEATIAAHLAETNAALERDEQISRAIIANPQFSIENGLLTSQYKPRRKEILDAYRDQISDRIGGIHVR
jgi:long-chain acyl-CoA synthetase